MTKYLFNSSGQWIAFKRGKYIFGTEGNWIGWTPWNNGDVVDPDGEYLGSITQNNRLYRFSNRPNRGYPGYPGYAGDSPLPPFAEDIEELETV